MEIYADSVRVDGLHHPLLRETSLRVSEGQVALVAGEPGEGHTAFALVLSGRLDPSYGDVLIDGAPNGKALRARVAPVDLPGVSAPEPTLVLSHVVAEELAMAHTRPRRAAVRRWLEVRDAAKYYDAQIGLLPPSTRIRILTDLAAARRGVRALILALPDRHGGRPEFWWRTACHYADQGYAVIVLCTATSARQLGIEPHHLGTLDGRRPAAATTTVVLADSAQLAIESRFAPQQTERLALAPGRATIAREEGTERPWADYTEDDELEGLLAADDAAVPRGGSRSGETVNPANPVGPTSPVKPVEPMLPGPSVRPGVFGSPDAPSAVPDVLPEELVVATIAQREKQAAKAAKAAGRPVGGGGGGGNANGGGAKNAERKNKRRERRQARDNAAGTAANSPADSSSATPADPADDSSADTAAAGSTAGATTEPTSSHRSSGGA